MNTDRVPRDIRRAWQVHSGSGVRVDAVLGGLTEGTLAAAMHATAQRSPTRPALLIPSPEGIGARWVSHGALDQRAARMAGRLVGDGLKPGDRVLLCGPNSIELVVAYLAILRAGGVAVPANPAYTRDELVHLVTDSETALAVCGPRVVDVLAGVVETVVDLGSPLPGAPPIPPVTVAPDATALLAYTSGTTGVPKGVPLTNANLLASIRAAMAAWRWREDDVLVHALPLSHQHGLGGVHATLLAGSRALVQPSFDAAALAQAAAAHRATVVFAVPAMYERLTADPAVAGLLSSVSLRLAVSGSAPLSPDLAERASAVLGEVPLERYGSTEAGLDVSNPIDGPRVPGTVGLPLPGVELRIADQAGRPVADGAEGEILVRGPQVFTGYRNLPEATAAAFHPGGWFRTGDLGRSDPGSGYLRITGRLKELVITGGMNVYPSEVERTLLRHPLVAEAAVAGLPSERWGEQVTAWVVLTGDAALDADDLVRHCRESLAPYKCPKQIFAVAALPRNSMGKITRRALVAPPAERSAEGLDTSALERAIDRLWRADLP